MSTAPSALTIPAANHSNRLFSTLTGALRTNLVAVGPRPSIVGGSAHLVVASGLDAGPARDWSRRVFPATAEGMDAAYAAFTALCNAAATVQP